ncbi:unnamed protein product [Clonostachys rosea f. rosea IK726]|jgi:hypothetical protein|uniref:Uncharacterized protein n=2 Tax=Bionectria ochroleuca TaxID=29856 RepID=A0A0B7JS65_BIOOC|nr:unnamed protein product [Clonostachys rosea f. rosea IK726]
MQRSSLANLASLMSGLAAVASATNSVPSLKVPACPSVGTATITKSVPDLTEFAKTEIGLCYNKETIEIKFTAHNETNFFFNPNQTTNGDIWEYEVVEAFIYKGTDDPQTYFEYEINPNNVTYQAFVYNPSENRAEGAPFDHLFVSDPAADGFTATTTLDRENSLWTSVAQIPLGLFNVKAGKAKGTKWRMNFFRTITSPETFPDQVLGGWSPPDKASFHITKFFGHVEFV